MQINSRIMNKSTQAKSARFAMALALGSAAAAAPAADFKLGETIELKINTTVTAGTGIRTEDPSTANFGSLSGNRVGRAGGLTNANTGGPDLNFESGSAYSTVLKGFADFDIHRDNLGAFARVKAWYDYELDQGDRPYGNYPNRYARGVPLSDDGFDREAKFSGAHFTDAYVYGKFAFENERQLDARLGRQVVGWGTAQFVTGGINVINPTDFAAFQRPGALPAESKMPVGMLYLNFAQAKQWGVDGFAMYEARHDVLNGCGTYFNVATYAPAGCLQASVLPTVSEAATVLNGRYVHRAADVEAKDSGQFGLSLRYTADALGTDFRAYGMNYHSRSFSLRGTNPNIAGGFGSLLTGTRLTDPNGVKYALMYVENIHLYGLSFDTRRGQATRVFGEIAYRPNQPLSLNFSDMADAFVRRNPNSLLNRPASGKNALALPPGATFDAFDRYKVTTASIGLNQGLPGVLGAQRIVVAGEVGWSHVTDLPGPDKLRYGRSDAYGTAAVPGFACTDDYPGKTCAHEGFITANAWGYRARIAITYNDAFLGATLTPSFLYSHDVDGYSYDGTFLEGRRMARPAIRAEWNKKYFVEIQYSRFSDGARYSMLVDRDNVVLVTGASF